MYDEVSHDVTINNDVTFSDDINLCYDVTVGDDVTISNDVTVGVDITVSDDVTLSDDVNVSDAELSIRSFCTVVNVRSINNSSFNDQMSTVFFFQVFLAYLSYLDFLSIVRCQVALACITKEKEYLFFEIFRKTYKAFI
jgi:acyl-[acyl carrier protein]--UDP-N-acetylglucosamine O-acyltransferase